MTTATRRRADPSTAAPEPADPAAGDRRPADLRLFGAALGTWGASLAGAYLSVRTSVAVGLAAAAAAAAAAVLARRLESQRTEGRRTEGRRTEGWRTGSRRTGSRRTGSRRIDRRWRPIVWALAAAALGATCGAFATAARAAPREAEPLASLTQQRSAARVELTLTGDPRLLTGGRPGPPTYLVPARLERIETDAVAVRLDAQAIVFATDPAWRTLLPSQRIATQARLAPPRGGDLTAAAVTALGVPRTLGSPSWSQVAAGRLRAGLQAACAPLPLAPGGLLPGLVIGDTSLLDPALADAFRTTGLTHLVAVSGANVAIILAVVLFAARWCRAGPWLCAAVCAVALVGFVILARPSASVVRAAAMGGIALLALATGRSRAAIPALAAAVIVGLLADPDLAGDPGFALSVLATGALVLLAPRWRDSLRARGIPPGLAEALAVPAAAQVACGPVIVALSGEVSLTAVPANLLAAPAVAPATLLGVGAAVVSPLWPDAAGFLAWCASWPARWLVGIATVGARVPAGAIPWPAGLVGGVTLAVVTVALLVAARRPAARRLVLVLGLAIGVGAAPVRWVAPGWPPESAVVVACDVGQGDALVLPTDDGEAVVVDAGPTPDAVDGCLRRLGVRVVAALVITHFHADHIGGLTGVLRGRSIGGLVVPTFDEPTEGEAVVRRAAGTVPVLEVGPGWSYSRGPLSLRVLGPTVAHTGTRSDPNNNSLVVRAVNRGVSVLLAGDAETEEQHDLVAADPAALKVDVLKVAHHGSAYQDPELLDATDPAVALVSVGAGNDYGHPNPALLARLSRDGARVLRTDLDGDLAVVATSPGWGVVVSGPHS